MPVNIIPPSEELDPEIARLVQAHFHHVQSPDAADLPGDLPSQALAHDEIVRGAARLKAALEDRREPKRGKRRPLVGSPASHVAGALARGRTWGYAVACLCVILGGVGLVTQWHRDGMRHGPQEYVTANGQRATISLADGSTVTLNVGTKLRVPEGFGRTSRTVYLEGEAQFDVTHDESNPFIVHAGGAVVRDLATVFGVRAYPGTSSTQVAVASGKVAVHAEAAPRPNGATVEAGQVATIAAGGETAVQASRRVNDLLAWTHGKLVIDDLPMREALMLLARWYDVEFDVPDARHLQGNLTTTADATALSQDELADLAFMLGARAERRGRVITILPLSHTRRDSQ